jgi:hypothetical protein
MGKMFQNASSLKPNCPGMIIGRFSVFYADRNPRWRGHLGFPIDLKNIKFVENLPMIIPGPFGFNCPSGFREEAF